jgi:hypothetical protein
MLDKDHTTMFGWVINKYSSSKRAETPDCLPTPFSLAAEGMSYALLQHGAVEAH